MVMVARKHSKLLQAREDKKDYEFIWAQEDTWMRQVTHNERKETKVVRFFVGPLQALLNRVSVPPLKPSFYEVIDGTKPVRLYLDLEAELAEGDEPFTERLANLVFRNMWHCVNEHLRISFPNHPPASFSIGHSCNTSKISFHVVGCNVNFDNAVCSALAYAFELRAYFLEKGCRMKTMRTDEFFGEEEYKRGGKILQELVDLSVYKSSQQFRLPGNTKKGKNRPLIPVIQNEVYSMDRATELDIHFVANQWSFLQFGITCESIHRDWLVSSVTCTALQPPLKVRLSDMSFSMCRMISPFRFEKVLYSHAQIAQDDMVPQGRAMSLSRLKPYILHQHPPMWAEKMMQFLLDERKAPLNPPRVTGKRRRNEDEIEAENDFNQIEEEVSARDKKLEDLRVSAVLNPEILGRRGGDAYLVDTFLVVKENGDVVQARKLTPGDVVYCNGCEVTHRGDTLIGEGVPSASVLEGIYGDLGVNCFNCSTMTWFFPVVDQYGFTITDESQRIVLPHGHRYLNQYGSVQVDMGADYRMLVLDAPMGVGKTEVMKSFLERQRNDVTILNITFRQSLAKYLAVRFGLCNYLDVQATEWVMHVAKLKRLSVCLDSLYKIPASARTYEIVIIDEAFFCFMHLVGGTFVGKPRELENAFFALNDVLTQARKIILMQHRITDVCIEWFKDMAQVPDDKLVLKKLEMPVHLHETSIVTSDLWLVCHIINNYLGQFDVERGCSKRPIIVFVTSQQYCQLLTELLRKVAENHFGPKAAERIKAIWAEIQTKTEFSKGFLEEPNIHSSQADVLLTTSVIMAGHSINTHFTDSYSFIFRGILTYREQLQFVSRLRVLDSEGQHRTDLAEKFFMYLQPGSYASFTEKNFRSICVALNAGSTVHNKVHRFISQVVASQKTEADDTKRRNRELWENEFQLSGKTLKILSPEEVKAIDTPSEFPQYDVEVREEELETQTITVRNVLVAPIKVKEVRDMVKSCIAARSEQISLWLQHIVDTAEETELDEGTFGLLEALEESEFTWAASEVTTMMLECQKEVGDRVHGMPRKDGTAMMLHIFGVQKNLDKITSKAHFHKAVAPIYQFLSFCDFILTMKPVPAGLTIQTTHQWWKGRVESSQHSPMALYKVALAKMAFQVFNMAGLFGQCNGGVRDFKFEKINVTKKKPAFIGPKFVRYGPELIKEIKDTLTRYYSDALNAYTGNNTVSYLRNVSDVSLVKKVASSVGVTLNCDKKTWNTPYMDYNKVVQSFAILKILLFPERFQCLSRILCGELLLQDVDAFLQKTRESVGL